MRVPKELHPYLPSEISYSIKGLDLETARFRCKLLGSRLAGAAGDLAKKQYTLDDIAAKWGFCDASSFCHAFKKLYSCRPGEFHSRNPIL